MNEHNTSRVRRIPFPRLSEGLVQLAGVVHVQLVRALRHVEPAAGAALVRHLRPQHVHVRLRPVVAVGGVPLVGDRRLLLVRAARHVEQAQQSRAVVGVAHPDDPLRGLALSPEVLDVVDAVDVLVVTPVALDGVVVGAVGDVEGRVPPVLVPREYLLREGQVHPEGVVRHRAPQPNLEGGEVVDGVVVVVGNHRADRYVAAAGRSFDGLEGVGAGVSALLSEAPSAAVNSGFVQSHGAVEGGRSEEAAIVLVRLGWRSRTVLG